MCRPNGQILISPFEQRRFIDTLTLIHNPTEEAETRPSYLECSYYNQVAAPRTRKVSQWLWFLLFLSVWTAP